MRRERGRWWGSKRSEGGWMQQREKERERERWMPERLQTRCDARAAAEIAVVEFAIELEVCVYLVCCPGSSLSLSLPSSSLVVLSDSASALCRSQSLFLFLQSRNSNSDPNGRPPHANRPGHRPTQPNTRPRGAHATTIRSTRDSKQNVATSRVHPCPSGSGGRVGAGDSVERRPNPTSQPATRWSMLLTPNRNLCLRR